MSAGALDSPHGSGLLPPIDRPSYRAGLRVMATPSIAIAAWGVVTGVAMVKAGLSVPIAIFMSIVVFAGSAQLAVLPLLHTGAPLVIVWLTATFINLRFVIFSAASRTYFSPLPWRQRLFAGYLNGDVGFALFMQRYSSAAERGNPAQWGFFYGLATLNWVSWQASSIAGILLGGLAPTSWGLELAAVLALVAVLIPMVTRLPAILGVVVTGVGSVATAHVPLKLGLVASVIAGVTVAVLAETHLPKRPSAIEEAADVAAHEGGYAS